MHEGGTEMTCSDVDPLIEWIADGELAPGPEIAAHLRACARCGPAVDLARQVHRVLAAQPAPVAPADLVQHAVARARRERWRAEQSLDVAFNVAVGLALVVGLGGLYLILNATGLVVVSADLARLSLQSAGELAARAAPQIRVYALATVLLLSALAVWWWAERGLEI